MAARKKANHDDRTRAKIRTSQLINRLEKHVLDDLELSTSQVSAALGLIKKTCPDLAAIHNTQDAEQKTLEDWLDELDADTEANEVKE